MRKLLLATTIIAFGVSPVMAQSDDSDSGSSTNAMSDNGSSSDAMSGNGDSMSNDATGSNASSSMSAEDMVASQEKVLKALSDAGYTDASIMDAAYMIQARTPDGEQVLMMIDTRGRVMGSQPVSASDSSSTGSSATSDDESSDDPASSDDESSGTNN